MLVLQPRMVTVKAWMGVTGVSVGVNGVNVKVGMGDGVSVFVAVLVTGVRTITPGVRMMGVAVMMFGSWEGTGVHTGSGCGRFPQVSQELSITTKNRSVNILFIILVIILPCSAYNQKRRQKQFHF